MAELAASAIALVQVTGLVIKKVYEFKKRASASREFLSVLLGKLEDLEKLVTVVKDAAEEGIRRPSVTTSTRDPWENINNTVKDCEVLLKRFVGTLDEISSKERRFFPKMMLQQELDRNKDDFDKLNRELSDRVAIISGNLMCVQIKLQIETQKMIASLAQAYNGQPLNNPELGVDPLEFSNDAAPAQVDAVSLQSDQPSTGAPVFSPVFSQGTTLQDDHSLTRERSRSTTSSSTDGQVLSDDLIRAIEGRNMSEVDSQLQAGADLTNRCKDGWTGLHYAAQCGSRRILERCLRAAPQGVNLGDRSGMTPLHKVAMTGRTEIGVILVDAGADIDVEDNDNRSPLYLAADSNKDKFVEMLLERGAKEDTEKLPPRFKEIKNAMKTRKRRDSEPLPAFEKTKLPKKRTLSWHRSSKTTHVPAAV